MKLNWVPNTLTLGNLTLGFVSMLITSEAIPGPKYQNSFVLAGLFIILAALFDGFDGIAARALNAQSKLGAELDSLADLTTFGIAPGFLVYKMFLNSYRADIFGTGVQFPYGMLIAAIFPICAAYRLARFNADHDPRYFSGLPSPVAGIFVGLTPLTFTVETLPHGISIPIFVIVALLMVSTIRFSKPQIAIRGKFTKEKMFYTLLGIGIMVYAIGKGNWPWLMYGMIFFYVFTAIISLIIQLIQEYRI